MKFEIMNEAMKKLHIAREGGDHGSIDTAIRNALVAWDPLHGVSHYIDELVDGIMRQSSTRDEAGMLLNRVGSRLEKRFDKRIDEVMPPADPS